MLTQRLAEFVIDTRTRDIPGAVMDASRDAFVDTLGVAIVGSLEEVGEIALRYVRDMGARKEATIWGTHVATTMAEAAFVNGIFGHALDFDDVHPSMQGHPSTTMVPAGIAVAEAAGTAGKDLLAAYAVGLEVGGLMGQAYGRGHYMKGWHATATSGVFASVAVAARILGLSVTQFRHAIGLAASQAGGMLRNFGTMTKPFHAGHAARCAVQSALLARAGFTADTSIFDGADGYFSTYAAPDGLPLETLVDRLGKPWQAVEPGIGYKRCYCNHRSIGALLKMIKEHDIRAQDVQAVEIGFPPGSDTALVSTNPKTGLEGKFSIEYVATATLLDGKLGIDTFTDVMVNRPEVRAFLPKVRRYRVEDPKTYSGTVGYNDVMVRTTKGEYKMRIDKAPGSPAWPMTAGERDEKFLDCAGRVLGGVGAKHALELAGAMVPTESRAGTKAESALAK
jgi:2-methylcitrate dehydratase PrpD